MDVEEHFLETDMLLEFMVKYFHALTINWTPPLPCIETQYSISVYQYFVVCSLELDK